MRPRDLVFAPSDVHALGHFSWGPLIVCSMAAASWRRSCPAARGSEARESSYRAVGAVDRAVRRAGVPDGRRDEPAVHWILALPIIVGIVLPDLPGAVVGCGFAVMLCGSRSWRRRRTVHDRSALGHAGGRGDALVFYAPRPIRRLRMRESRPPDAHEVVAARVRASGAAVARATGSCGPRTSCAYRSPRRAFRSRRSSEPAHRRVGREHARPPTGRSYSPRSRARRGGCQGSSTACSTCRS